jgi:hypothetical protein
MPSTINLTNQTNALQLYSFAFIIPVGFITNVLNILVNARDKFQQTTMGFYNIFWSIFNIFWIICLFLQASIPLIGLNKLILKSDIACKLLPYFVRLFGQLNMWINVVASFDRLLLMSYENLAAYNNRFLNNNNKIRLLKILVLMVLILSAVNSPGLLFYLETDTVVFNNLTNQTSFTIQCTSTPLISLIRDSISSLFRIVLPIVIQTVISCILIYKLSVLEINVTTLSLKKEYRFTFTMVIINLLFIFSQLLLLMGLIFTNIYGYNQTYISTTSNESAVSSFFYTCAILCSTFINTNLLFFVNLITNFKFREEAKKIFVK